jgi:hypothetical protein
MNGTLQPSTGVRLVARCRWCIERLGCERYRLAGVWQVGLGVPFTDARFTDDICPECEQEFFPEYAL